MVFPGTVYLHKYTVLFLCRFGKRRKKAPTLRCHPERNEVEPKDPLPLRHFVPRDALHRKKHGFFDSASSMLRSE